MAPPGRGQGRRPGRVYAGTWPEGSSAPAGGWAPTGFGNWPAVSARLREWAAAEAGAGRLMPWVPVAFGVGIAFYFAADHEPARSATAVAAAMLGAAAFALRRHKLFPVMIMVAAMASGFAVATWRTVIVGHSVLARPMFGAQLSGF